MLFALLLAAAQLPQAVDAERRFAALAAERGQWPAKQATAAPDAVIFMPHLTNALEYLSRHTDPGRRYRWRPARVFTSCDDTVSVTTGPWSWADGGRHGLFTTIWQRQTDGVLRWRLDDGDALLQPWAAPEEVAVTAPSCDNLPATATLSPTAPPAVDLVVQQSLVAPSRSLPSTLPREAEMLDHGAARDHSLVWELRTAGDGGNGEHVLRIYQWDGQRYRLALWGHWGAAQ
jgi:hypothetical protein